MFNDLFIYFFNSVEDIPLIEKKGSYILMKNIRENTLYFQFIVGRQERKKKKRQAAVHGHASGVAGSYTHPTHKIMLCLFHAFLS